MINRDNKVATNISLDSGATSEFVFEKEILLLPFFTFRVVEVTRT